MGLKFPFTTTPQDFSERIEELLSCYREEIKNEIDRGNDLCEIIYKLVNGPQMLTPGEADRVKRIDNNIRHRRAYSLTIDNMRSHDLWNDFISDYDEISRETSDDHVWLIKFQEWILTLD